MLPVKPTRAICCVATPNTTHAMTSGPSTRHRARSMLPHPIHPENAMIGYVTLGTNDLTRACEF